MKLNRIIVALIAVVFLVSLSSESYSQKQKPRRKVIHAVVDVSTSEPTTTLSPEMERRQAAFLKTWEAINDNYFDSTFSGLDWEKIRAEYQPRVTAAKTDQEFHLILEEMINRLGRSHFAIIPPEYFQTLEKAKARAREKRSLKQPSTSDGAESSGDSKDTEIDLQDLDAKYGIGIELRMIAGHFVISRVDEDSSAAEKGLKPGFILDKIDGVLLDDLIRRTIASYPSTRNIQQRLPSEIVGWFLNGKPNTTVNLTCLDGVGQASEYEVPRRPLGGDTISFGSRFPLQYLQFESKSLTDNVGYIRFNVFAIPMIGKFCDAISQFAAKKALIIDLRGNVGGVVGTLVALNGMLSDHLTVIGTSIYRDGSERLIATPKVKNFKGKIVILVDGQSASAAELFAAGMQDNHRALIVGERTSAEALPSITTPLATGAVLIYPIADFKTPNGRSVEGNGVEPDYKVSFDRESLLKGTDVQLEKALSLVNSDASEKDASSSKKLLVRSEPLPPPPPPKASGPPRIVAGNGGALTPPTSTKPPKAPVKDAKSLKVIADFAEKIGGADNIQSISSYDVSGSGIVGLHGSEMEIALKAFRQTPDKFLLLMTSDASGEVREIYNGKKKYLQSEMGIEREIYSGVDTRRSQLFPGVFDLTDPTFLSSVSFEGVFDLDGRKVNILSAKSETGIPIGMAFDVESKFLVRFTLPGLAYTLGDYRKVDKVMLPFMIDLEHIMQMRLETVHLNSTVDPANFEKKENCFDRPN